MAQETDPSLSIQQTTGLQPKHFADLLRAAQLVFDPRGGLSGRNLVIDWANFGIPPSVAENLQQLGKRYRYASPHMPIALIWQELLPETRNWFMENRNDLWQLEEFFPALDED